MAGVSVKIGADDREFQAAIKRTKKELAGIAGEAREGINSLAKWGAAATAAGVAATSYLVKSAIDGARELEKMRQVANAGTAEFQKGAFAVRSLGIETDKYADILKDVNDRVGDFIQTGGGPMADFFENIAPKVGVTAKQFQKLSGPQALQLYVDSLQKANVSQQDMTFYLETMASDATALIPLLRDGGAAMAEQAAQAERLGLVMSDIEVAQLEQASMAMSQVASVFEGFVNQLSSELAPVITAISKQFLQVTEDAGGVGEAASDSFKFIVDSAAFVMDAVHGIGVVFQSISDAMIIGFTTVANHVSKVVGGMMVMIDSIPGVDMSESINSVMQFQQTMEGVGVEAKKALHDRLMEPLPSEQFREFVAEARAAGEESARAIAEGRKAVEDAQRGGDGNVQTQAEKAAAEERRKFLNQQIEDIRQSNLTELELEREKYAEKALILQEARERGLEIEGGYDEQLLALKQGHEDRLAQLEQDALDKRLRLEKQAADARLGTIQGALSSISSLMNSENRKMFEIGKAAAIAQSIINTYQGVSEAWKLGPILGPPLAALVATAGFANVANIRKQSFGGGGGGAAGVAGAGTAGLASAQTPGVGIQGNQQQSQTMFVQGINPTDIFTGEQLVSIINTAQENGAVLRTS